jgi:hypothetical protein
MGYPQWFQNFGGNGNEIAKGVVQLADSGFVLVGYTSSFGAGGYDAWIVRTDKAGNKLWDKTFGGENWDFGNDVVIGSDSSIFVTGYTESYGNGGKDGFVVKLDKSGNILASKFYGGGLDDELNAIIKTNDGELACVGYTKSRADVNGDAYFLKINKNLDTLFSRIFGWNGRDFATDILQRPDNEYVICGGKKPTNSQYSHSWMYSLNAVGDSLWENSYYASQTDEAFVSVAQSGVNLLNSCYIRNVPVPALKEQINIFLAKPEGWPVIINSSGATEDEYANAIEPTSDGGYIIVGSTTGFGAKGKDVIFFKHDSTIINYQSLVDVPKVETIQNSFEINLSNETIHINGKKSDFPSTVKVYAISGELLFEKSVSGPDDGIRFPSTIGMYILKANGSGGDVIYKKILMR